MIKLGSHVGMKAPEYMLGSAKEAASYGANVMMIYTGAPQNTKRKDLSELRIDDAREYMQANGIVDVVVHAPYIMNLGNADPEKYRYAVDFFANEVKRSQAMGASCVVLHPGNHLDAPREDSIKQIAEALNEIITPDQEVVIALETMSGKGTEIGTSFEELAQIINLVDCKDKVGVCLDTCHIHDAGYDLTNFDAILDEFDQVIGLDKLVAIHLNDSKNEKGASKDRHENIGLGYIGFDVLASVVHNPRIKDVPKVLETPYIDKAHAPYKQEIAMLLANEFNENLVADIIEDKN